MTFRKSVSWLLLGLYLATNAHFGEWLKLPELVQHYEEHQLMDSDLSWLEFVVMHYFDEERHTGDHDEDHDLPFQHCCQYFFADFKGLQQSHLSGLNLLSESNQRAMSAPKAFNFALLAHDIWHPPR